jgi:hypothetical protein
MKAIQIIVVAGWLGVLFFFAFRWKSDEINLEGEWEATKIVVNGKDLIADDVMNKYFHVGDGIEISPWGDSIAISTVTKYKMHAHFVIAKDRKQITLSSGEAALNGNYKLEIDTTHVGPQAYRVEVKIMSEATSIHFYRQVVVPPWKPEFPRRGQV